MTSGTNYATFNLWHKCTDEDAYAIQRSKGGMLLVSDDGGSLVVSSEPCTGFPFRIMKKGDPNGIEEAETVVTGNEERLISCSRESDVLRVNAVEGGLLRLYSFDGRLLKTHRCGAGMNVVELPLRNAGLLILQYVGETGRTQSLKLR